MKFRAASLNAFDVMLMKYSIDNAAMFPAIAISPKELMEAAMTMFARQKLVLWKADGIPIEKILFTTCRLNLSFLTYSPPISLVTASVYHIKAAEMPCEMMVAVATPATFMWRTITKYKLSSRLITPEMPR